MNLASSYLCDGYKGFFHHVDEPLRMMCGLLGPAGHRRGFRPRWYVAPGPARRGLDWLSALISNHGRQLTTVLIGSLGAPLILRGVIKALGI